MATVSERRAPAAQPLPAAFFAREVLTVARELIGCVLAHGPCRGVIVETEAYHQSEPACHAYIGRTPRTATLYGPPGRAYVYRSYGIHALLNAVCEPEGVGAAVLIRALYPLQGIELMAQRRRTSDRLSLCSGPGKLSQALGIDLSLNGSSLRGGPIRIYPRHPRFREPELVRGPRIGISKATELPWRFAIANCKYVSKPWPWRRSFV